MFSGLLKVISGFLVLGLCLGLLLLALIASERGNFEPRVWELPVMQTEHRPERLPGALRVTVLDAEGLSGVQGIPAGTDAAARAAVQAFGRRLYLQRADVLVLYRWPMVARGIPDRNAFRALGATLGLEHAVFLPTDSRHFALPRHGGGHPVPDQREEGILVLSRFPMEIEDAETRRPRSGPLRTRVFGARQGRLCVYLHTAPDLRRSLCVIDGVVPPEKEPLPDTAGAHRRILASFPGHPTCSSEENDCAIAGAEGGGPGLRVRGAEVLLSSGSNRLEGALSVPMLLVELRFLDVTAMEDE